MTNSSFVLPDIPVSLSVCNAQGPSGGTDRGDPLCRRKNHLWPLGDVPDGAAILVAIPSRALIQVKRDATGNRTATGWMGAKEART